MKILIIILINSFYANNLDQNNVIDFYKNLWNYYIKNKKKIFSYQYKSIDYSNGINDLLFYSYKKKKSIQKKLFYFLMGFALGFIFFLLFFVLKKFLLKLFFKPHYYHISSPKIILLEEDKENFYFNDDLYKKDYGNNDSENLSFINENSTDISQYSQF